MVKNTGTRLQYIIVVISYQIHAAFTKVIKPNHLHIQSLSFSSYWMIKIGLMRLKNSTKISRLIQACRMFLFHPHWSNVRQQQTVQRSAGSDRVYTSLYCCGVSLYKEPKDGKINKYILCFWSRSRVRPPTCGEETGSDHVYLFEQVLVALGLELRRPVNDGWLEEAAAAQLEERGQVLHHAHVEWILSQGHRMSHSPLLQ